jgi:hypothetical protein
MNPVREQAGLRLYVVHGGARPDQAVRLRRFREEHPDVEIILRGPWQAVFAEPYGERTVTRWPARHRRAGNEWMTLQGQ